MAAVLTSTKRPYGRDFKPMPETVPPLELVPTEAELLAADRARAAFKADQRHFAVRDNFALEQQNGRAS